MQTWTDEVVGSVKGGFERWIRRSNWGRGEERRDGLLGNGGVARASDKLKKWLKYVSHSYNTRNM